MKFDSNKIFFTHASFYPSTFLQPVNSSKNSILNWVLKLNFFISLQVIFFVYVWKKPRQIFYSFKPLFYSCKSQIHTEQAGLTIQFVIPWKISAIAFKKSKTNMMVVQMLLFFVSLCITHSLLERLTGSCLWIFIFLCIIIKT